MNCFLNVALLKTLKVLFIVRESVRVCVCACVL